ncbi:hypothetical protein JCM13304A_09390 [Desulfothermus okinawensis JCM 13304]
MTKYEQETVINFNELDGEAEVYTSSPRVAKVLLSRGLKPYKTESVKGKDVGWFFRLPRHSVILKPSNRIIRVGGYPN